MRKKLNADPVIALSLSSLAVIPIIKATVEVYPFVRENNTMRVKVNTPINELLIFNLCIFLNLETSKFESIKTN
jgi:hypothetical protein